MGDLVIVYENHSKTLILQHCATIIFEAKILEFLCQKINIQYSFKSEKNTNETFLDNFKHCGQSASGK